MDFLLENDDISLLAEIYELNELNYDIAKETVMYNHAYRTIGNPDILTEGFADSLGKIGDFFKKMIEKIKEFFKKIFMYITSCTMEIDKFVKKYRKELDALDKIDFEIEGYEWTLHDAPDMTDFQKVVNDYNSSLSDVPKMKKDEILKQQNEFLESSNLDQIRGRVLGSGERIPEEDFQETVRKYYRNGEDKTQSIHITTSEYRSILSDAENVVKKKKEAEKTRDELIVLLDKTQNFFDKKASVMYVSGTKKIKTNTVKTDDNKFSTGSDDYINYSNSTAGVMETLLRFKYTQANRLAGIINIVASERANALKDQVKWYRQVIRKGLFKDDSKNDSSSED